MALSPGSAILKGGTVPRPCGRICRKQADDPMKRFLTLMLALLLLTLPALAEET